MDATGFLMLGRYVSHMSGNASALADGLASGLPNAALGSLGALAAFILGGACSAVLINWRQSHSVRNPFVLPLLLEAAALLCFGFAGRDSRVATGNIDLIILLAFAMGVQNATSSQMSDLRMRTTHVTGISTDVGVGLGRLVYRRPSADDHLAEADRKNLSRVFLLLFGFLAGGIAGTVGFPHLGSFVSLPLALVLFVLAGLLSRTKHVPV